MNAWFSGMKAMGNMEELTPQTPTPCVCTCALLTGSITHQSVTASLMAKSMPLGAIKIKHKFHHHHEDTLHSAPNGNNWTKNISLKRTKSACLKQSSSLMWAQKALAIEDHCKFTNTDFRLHSYRHSPSGSQNCINNQVSTVTPPTQVKLFPPKPFQKIKVIHPMKCTDINTRLQTNKQTMKHANKTFVNKKSRKHDTPPTKGTHKFNNHSKKFTSVYGQKRISK